MTSEPRRTCHRAALSERQLSRLLLKETLTTPGRPVERVRVAAAREVLEKTAAPLEAVATRRLDFLNWKSLFSLILLY